MKTIGASFYRYFPVSRRDKNWGLYATTAGETRVAPHVDYPPGGHPKGYAFDWQHGRVLEEFGLVYISSGGGKFESRNFSTILVIARIQNEFDRDLNIKSLAQELGVSYSRFRHTFAAHTGLSPHQYLLELRLVRARSLLAETELSVKEIALQTGFVDELYFSRLFRQKLNLTPSQWRNRSRQPKREV